MTVAKASRHSNVKVDAIVLLVQNFTWYRSKEIDGAPVRERMGMVSLASIVVSVLAQEPSQAELWIKT